MFNLLENGSFTGAQRGFARYQRTQWTHVENIPATNGAKERLHFFKFD
jgi:hypothetical protein